MNTEIAGRNLLLNKVMIQLNVFCVSMKHGIESEIGGRDVTINGERIKKDSKLTK